MTDPEIVDQTATTTAVVHGLVPMTEIVGFFDRSFTELAAVLNEQGITPTGPAFARYAGPPGETADLEVGFPVDQAWIAGQGLTPGADLWEVYVTEPNPDMDPGDLRTELMWTVTES